MKRLDCNLNYVPDLVQACMILHNFCEIHCEQFDYDWLEPDPLDVIRVQPESAMNTELMDDAVTIRAALTDYCAL